jgi:hypothetical protein
MKYNVTMNATVEAESAEAAKNLFIDFSDNKEGVLSSSIDAIPSNQWAVTVSVPVIYKFDLTVNAETEDEAEQLATNEVELMNEIEEFVKGELVTDYYYDVDTSAVEVQSIEDLDDEHEDPEPAQPVTATAVDDNADSAAPDTTTAA